MQWARRGLMLVIACAAGGVLASEPDYGKVDTFQPGKKYSCLPTADHKAWDCSEAGKATIPANGPETARVPPPPTQTAPTPHAITASTSSVDAAPAAAVPSYLRASPETAPTASVPAETAVSTPAAPETPPPQIASDVAAPAQHSEVLPPAPVAQATPAPSNARVETPAAPPPPPPPPTTIADTSAPPPPPVEPVAPSTQAVTAPATSEPAASAAPITSIGGNQQLLALPASGYVIELAHGASRADLDAVRNVLQLPRGVALELHLSRDGADWWLLVWASFDNIAAARSARAELAATTSTAIGWPRPIGALQTEVRRIATN